MNIVPEAPWEHPYERVKKGLEEAERIAKHGDHNQLDHARGRRRSNSGGRVTINTTGTSSARKLQSRRKPTMLGPSSNPLLKHPNVASRKRAKMKWLKGERARRARDI